MAEIMQYFDYSESMPLTCACGWAGPVKDAPMEISERDPLFDRSCPRCGTMLLIVPYPTFEQTREAAEAGNTEAIEMCRRQNIPAKLPKPQ
jgi:hypothetical protein